MVIMQYHRLEHLEPMHLRCIASVLKHKPKDVKHILITENPFPELEIYAQRDYRYLSDLIRLKWASQHPDCLYLDTDVMVDRWPDWKWEQGMPYFSTLDGQGADLFAFYVNDCPYYFQQLLEFIGSEIGWCQNLINSGERDFYEIKRGYFQHLSAGRMFITDKLVEYGCDKFRVFRNSTGRVDLDYHG